MFALVRESDAMEVSRSPDFRGIDLVVVRDDDFDDALTEIRKAGGFCAGHTFEVEGLGKIGYHHGLECPGPDPANSSPMV